MTGSNNPGSLDAMNSMRRKKPRASRKGRKNLTFKDKVELIATIERNLNNLHEHDWQTVSELFNRQAEHDSRPPRTATSVRSAFNKLRSRKKPTGDASLDDLIDRANKLHTALYRNGKMDGLSSGGSEDEDDHPTGDLGASEMTPTSQNTSFASHPPSEPHNIPGPSTHSSGRLPREPRANKRARTSGVMANSHQSDNTPQSHPSSDIMGHGGSSQYNPNLLGQPSKDFMVPMADTPIQQTQQRSLGHAGNNSSNLFSPVLTRSLSPLHRNLGATTYSSFSVPVPTNSSTPQNSGHQDGRSSKPRSSDMSVMNQRAGLSGSSSGSGNELLQQSSPSMTQPVFLNDGSVMPPDNNYEILSSLRRENNNYREECYNLRNKELEYKNELYNVRKLHDKELARKDSIIAEKDARIERLIASVQASGASSDDSNSIRLLKETVEEKTRQYSALQAEVDFLNQKLKFSNVALEQLKTLHEMEIKRYKLASELNHPNGSNE